MEYTLNSENNGNIVILENYRKNKFGLITTEKYMLQKFDYGLKRQIPSATRDG
jgi:hypothetical protein